jgi:plastocyanin
MHVLKLTASSLLVLALLALAGPSFSAPKPTPLVATVGPGFTITLTKAGKKVTTVKPGRYSITVRDRSAIHNFHLTGPGVNRKSTVAEVRTLRPWVVTLKRGTYRYVCDPHAATMKGRFTVR